MARNVQKGIVVKGIALLALLFMAPTASPLPDPGKAAPSATALPVASQAPKQSCRTLQKAPVLETEEDKTFWDERSALGPFQSRAHLESLVASDPLFALPYLSSLEDILKEQSWGAELLERAARLAAKRRPYDLLRYSFVGDRNLLAKLHTYPWFETVLKDVVEWHERKQEWGMLVSSAEVYAAYAWSKPIVKHAAYRLLAEHRYSQLLSSHAGYQDEPWAEEILKQASRNLLRQHTVSSVLDAAASLKRYSWGETIIKQAVMVSSTWERIAYSDLYLDYPWGETALKNAVSEALRQEDADALDVFLYYTARDRIAGFPWGPAAVLKAARIFETAGLLDPFLFAEKYRNYAWAEGLIRELIGKQSQGSGTLELELLVHYADVYHGFPWGDDIFRAASISLARTKPRIFEIWPFALRLILKKQWAEEFAKVLLETLDQSVRGQDRNSSSAYYSRESLFSYLESFKDRLASSAWFERLLKNQADYLSQEKEWAYILSYADMWRRYPWGERLIERTAWSAVEEDPLTLLVYADRYWSIPCSATLLEQAARRLLADSETPTSLLSYFRVYIDEPWGPEVLEAAARRTAAQAPPLLFQSLPALLHIEKGPEVVLAASRAAPFSLIFDSYTGRSIWKKVQQVERLKNAFAASEDPAIQTLTTILAGDDPNGWAELHQIVQDTLSLLHKITYEGLTVGEAKRIAANPEKLFRALIEIRRIPNHAASFTVERALEDSALRIVLDINDLHNEPDAARFRSVAGATPEELWTLIVYGEDELYTSSFNGLFSRMVERMKSGGMSGEGLLDRVGRNKTRTFIKLAISFNRMNEFLATLAPQNREALLQSFVRELETDRDMLGQATVVADTFSVIEDPGLLRTFQRAIKEEYKRVRAEGKKDAEVLYGLLASMFAKKAVIDEAWIKEMAAKYRLADLMEFDAAALFDKTGTFTAQYFFYNDEDGRASFASFLAQYRNRPGWTIERAQDGSYLVIRSAIGKRKIALYANKPSQDSKGQEAIEEFFKKRQIVPTMIVHRGHSYHAPSTIRNITDQTLIVYLGSCGSYNNVSEVLNASSQAHIISTKGTGTVAINDPLLRMLTEEIQKGGAVDWKRFWENAASTLGSHPDFRNYIAPHRNLGVLFLKAYRTLTEERR